MRTHRGGFTRFRHDRTILLGAATQGMMRWVSLMERVALVVVRVLDGDFKAMRLLDEARFEPETSPEIFGLRAPRLAPELADAKPLVLPESNE
jgi:hypothetical protein